jgi:hypothetical protein
VKKILLYGGLAVLALAIGVILYLSMNLNSLLVTAVETFGPRITDTEVRLADADVSPLSGAGELEGLFVGNPQGFKTDGLMRVGSVSIVVDTGSLTSDTVLIKKVEVLDPELTYEVQGGTSNIKALQRNIRRNAGSGETASGDSGGKKVIIEDFVMRGGTVHLALGDLGGAGTTVSLPEIHLTDIGRDSGGATPAEAVGQIFNSVTGTVVPAVTKSVNMMGEGVKQGAETLQKGVEGAAQKLKGLFGD